MLRAQKEIYDDMEEEDWPRFRDSDLFVKAAQDLRPNAHLAAGLASSVGSLARRDAAFRQSHDRGGATADGSLHKA